VVQLAGHALDATPPQPPSRRPPASQTLAAAFGAKPEAAAEPEATERVLQVAREGVRELPEGLYSEVSTAFAKYRAVFECKAAAKGQADAKRQQRNEHAARCARLAALRPPLARHHPAAPRGRSLEPAPLHCAQGRAAGGSGRRRRRRPGAADAGRGRAG
jgi:hypothetical protein